MKGSLLRWTLFFLTFPELFQYLALRIFVIKFHVMKYSLFFALALMACSSNPEVVHLRTEKAKKKEVVKVEPNKTLTADIDGMTCEMGCGGSIRTKLKGTGAVSRVQFDFVEGRKTQGMTVFFDETKISQKQIKDILLTMNEQQFTLANVAVQSLEK